MKYVSAIYNDLDSVPTEVIMKWQSLTSLVFDQTFEWYGLLFDEVLRSTCELRVIVVYSSNNNLPVAVLPLAVSKNPELRFGIHRLHSLTSYYSSDFGLISLETEFEQSVFDELCRVISDMKGESRYFELEPVPVNSNFFVEMSRALTEHGYILSPYRRFTNWYHMTNGQSFEEYFETRNGQIRNTYKRKEKKLQRKGYELDILRDADSVQKAMPAYHSVYKNSWKGNESHTHFIDAMCRTFAEKGWLRLGILKVAERPIAAQIWIVLQGVASIYKLSYDESFKALSAGTILTMAMFRHVMDVDKVEKIDYLTGDDAYKRDYMSSNRKMWSLRAYRMYTMAAPLGYIERAKDFLRKTA